MQTVTAVRAGQTATFECADNTGWMRRPVPGDGILVETDTTTAFVGAQDAIWCLEQLGYVVRRPPEPAAKLVTNGRAEAIGRKVRR